MFKAIPKYKQGILAVLALLLVAAACDLDSHTAALPPDASQEQVAAELPFDLHNFERNVFRIGAYREVDNPSSGVYYAFVTFESYETFSLWRSKRTHLVSVEYLTEDAVQWLIDSDYPTYWEGYTVTMESLDPEAQRLAGERQAELIQRLIKENEELGVAEKERGK